MVDTQLVMAVVVVLIQAVVEEVPGLVQLAQLAVLQWVVMAAMVLFGLWMVRIRAVEVAVIVALIVEQQIVRVA